MRAVLDAADRRILKMLRVNGRISNLKLANGVGLSPSTCARRVAALERSKVIVGYTALVATASSAEKMVVVVEVTLDRQTKDFLSRFEFSIARQTEIRHCFLMTGEADYLLWVEVKDAAHYERLHRETLSRLPGVARIQSYFTIRSVI